jgi:hypothetical protein
MQSMEHILALWQTGLLSSSAVVGWADAEIRRSNQPSQAVIDLSLYGPEQCLKRPLSEFPARPATLNYVQEFALRALAVSLPSYESVLSFANWASRYCMGEDLSDPIVALGYQLDHLLDDCQDKQGAVELARKELPSLLPVCRRVSAPFLETGA